MSSSRATRTIPLPAGFFAPKGSVWLRGPPRLRGSPRRWCGRGEAVAPVYVDRRWTWWRRSSPTPGKAGSLGVCTTLMPAVGMLKSLDERFWNMRRCHAAAGSLCSSAGIAPLTAHYGRYLDPSTSRTRGSSSCGARTRSNQHHMSPAEGGQGSSARVALIDPAHGVRRRGQVIQPRPGATVPWRWPEPSSGKGWQTRITSRRTSGRVQPGRSRGL